MRPILTVLLALLCASALADDDAAPAGERSPGDMSVEERTEMMKATNDYNRCVYQKAMGGAEGEPDIRRVADAALGACEPALEALRAKIRGWKFPDHFAEGFARTVRDRAARSVLPELAARKSN
ncbi:MAG: hypothetical protein AB7I01_13305 [Gammaproteobacteria bacterium]